MIWVGSQNNKTNMESPKKNMKVTVQGVNGPVPAAMRGVQAGSRSSISNDCNDTVVAHLANVSDNVTSVGDTINPFRRASRLARTPEKASTASAVVRTRSSPPSLGKNTPTLGLTQTQPNYMSELGESINKLIEMIRLPQRSINNNMRDLLANISKMHARAQEEFNRLEKELSTRPKETAMATPKRTREENDMIRKTPPKRSKQQQEEVRRKDAIMSNERKKEIFTEASSSEDPKNGKWTEVAHRKSRKKRNIEKASSKKHSRDIARNDLTLHSAVITESDVIRVDFTGIDNEGTEERRNMTCKQVVSHISAFRTDISEVRLYRKFNLTDKLGSYIKYVPGIQRIRQTTCAFVGALSEYYTSSVEMFATDRSYILHGFNEEYFTSDCSLKFTGGVPLSSAGVSDYGVVGESAGLSLYFNGIIGVIAKIMGDNTVLRDMKQIKPVGIEVPRFLRGVMIDNPDPSLVLASEHNGIRWLKNFIDDLVNQGDSEFIYYYGRAGSERDASVNVKLLEYFAVNVDQYYASIVNINARYLRSEGDIEERLRSIIDAYAIRGVAIELPEITGLTPFNSFDTDTAVQVVLVSAFLRYNFVNMVLEDNLRYFEACNLFSYDENFLLYDLRISKADQSNLINFLSSRIDSCDFSYVNYMMALEVSPVFYICTSTLLSSQLTHEQCVILLLEFYLFAITFPNNFDRIKGILQKTFYEIFEVLCPVEAFTLKRAVWYIYTIDRAGRPVFDVTTGIHFRNKCDYLLGRYPSIFADLSQMGVPHIHAIMSLFVPIGEYVSDTLAVAAGFPRLSREPGHYIPFKYRADGTGTEFSSSVRNFVIALKGLLSFSNRADNSSRSSAPYVASKMFLDSVIEHFKEFDATVNTLVPLHYRARANTMFNIGDSFSGSLRDFKRTDYCMTSDGLISRRLYRHQYAGDSRFRLCTAVVWQLYGHGTSVLMRRTGCHGKRIAQVTVNESIVVPNESVFVQEALEMYNFFERTLIPITLVSIIFSDQLFVDVRDKRIIRDILRLDKVPVSVLNRVMACAADVLKIDVSDMLKLYEIHDYDVTGSPACINPTIRRLSLEGADIVPFDADVDNPNIANCLCPISPNVRERLRVAMSLIVNLPGFKPRKGLRFCRNTNIVWYPDYTPRPSPNAVEMRYTRDIIKRQRVQGSVRNCWVINGVPMYRDYPNTHLVIDDTQDITESHIGLILEGINMGWLMVDVPNQNYIPVIVPGRVIQFNMISDILRKGMDKLVTIEFTDGTGCPDGVLMAPRGDESYEQYIFPIHSVTQNYLIGSLSDYDQSNVPSGTKLPSKYNLDTGQLDARMLPVYSDGINSGQCEGVHEQHSWCFHEKSYL